MKKIKLSTSLLKLKKEEISDLTTNEMQTILGGNPGTGYCTTGTCNTDGCQPQLPSIDYTCGPGTYTCPQSYSISLGFPNLPGCSYC